MWDDLLNRFQNFSSGWRRKHHSEFNWNQTNLGRYLVINRKVCLIANDEEQLEKIVKILYLSPKTKKSYFAIIRDTFDLVKMPQWYDTIEQLTVLKKGHPYSNCSKNARFRCLNECFRRGFRLAKYLYESSETGLIRLNFSDRNQTIEESEKSCFGKCKKENCKLVQMITARLEKRPKVETFEARPKLSAFDYWVQMIGLLCSFAGLSLNEFAFLAVEFTQSKMRNRKVRIALFCLKLAILLLGLATFGYLCTRVTLDHRAEDDNPIEKEKPRHLILPKIVHLAICVNIITYVNASEEKTMGEIERATEGALDDVLEGIYMDYQGKTFTTDYLVRPIQIFKFGFRCFSLVVHPHYQTMTSSPILRIVFKEGVYTPHLYLLTEDENLNRKSFPYSGKYAFQKRIVRRLRLSGKCTDYGKKFVNCTGRQNCVEWCIARKFVESYNRTTFGTGGFYYYQVIHKDWFSPTEWNTFRLMRIRNENQSIYESIRQQCLQETENEKPCDEVRFEETVKISQLEKKTGEIFINLQFEVIQSVEEESSWYKLTLNITSLQSLLFGLSALGILQMIASLIQIASGVRKSKLILFFLYLLCSFGASWHTYHILHLVVSGELVPTKHYELVKQIQMPAVVFCLPIDEKLVDTNHQMTGNYLEKVTRHMTATRMFANVTYLNGSNEWVPFSSRRVKHFFLLNMKCFRIEIDQQYQRDQFHFSTKKQMLKVNFIKKLDKEKNFVHFMTKSKETVEFSKIVILKYSAKSSVTHETILYEYADRFSFIRRNFHSLQEVGDLPEQLLDLQDNEHRLKTLNLPLEEEEFGMEVNEDLFEQLYYSSAQKNKNKGTNYQQQFVNNHLREDKQFDSDFSFSVAFLQKVVSSTNEENLGQLILGLLNVLFIWFDLGVLDLHPVFVHFHGNFLIYLYIRLPTFVCRWLKKLKSLLYEPLIHRQPIRRRVRRF